MKVLIVEDEKPAIEKLEQLIRKYDPEIEIVGTCISVDETVKWLETERIMLIYFS